MCCCRLPPRNQMFQPAGNLSQSLQFRCWPIKWVKSKIWLENIPGCQEGLVFFWNTNHPPLWHVWPAHPGKLWGIVQNRRTRGNPWFNFPFHCIVQVSTWRETVFFTSFTKNNLLRICNDLLRRLSRTQNTVFCGRILLFLAKFFPFSERLQLNAQHF